MSAPLSSIKTFTDSPYSLEHFKDFIQGIFPNAQPLNLPKIPYDREIIKSYTQVCNDIALDSGNILQVYAFETQHLRAKVTLHKELGAIAKSQASHILACFYDESNPSEFRLSLITTGFENGKQTHSSPSRQSFVLGESIPTHTAKKQLSSLLHPHSPHSKESLESAFSIEPVSKEFYEAISSHFLDFLDSLALPAISADSDYENTKREFALRLLCRVLFCKFLEKKGLIDSGIFDTNLSQNYYHEVLEPLFFSTLNTHKDHRDYTHLPAQVAALLDSIPYLNGGLFAPQASDFYDSKEPFANIVQLKIPNACFAKLFETLRLYHFTLDENTPESKEVGLDPELLGMVFENLLSVLFTDNRLENAQSLRKKTGSYYTPREIVSYMCKNALFQALLSKLGDLPLGDCLADSQSQDSGSLESKTNFAKVCKVDSSDLAQKPTRESSDSKICDEKCGLQGKSQGSYLSGNDCRDFSPLPHLSRKAESHADLRSLIFDKHATPSLLQSKAQILATLNSLKILDPACGSGAFPLGILQEILEIQEALGDTRSLYERKLAILQSNIYGIDIQPMATEISRLRCFLSLIVDESSHSIDPLPNLEFKFISANSLLPLPQTTTLEYDGYQADREKLDSIRASTFSAPAESKLELKERYQKQASKIAQSLILSGEGESALTRWDPYDPHSVAEFFDSSFMFGFSHFDIIIGNPPYISSENMPQVIKDNRHLFKTAHKKTDIYVFFYELAFNLLRESGIVTFITSNKFLSQEYGLKLRELFLKNTIHTIINFNLNVFASASVDTCIISARKSKPSAFHQVQVQDIHTQADYDSFTKGEFNFIDQESFKNIELCNFRLNLTKEKLTLLGHIKSQSLRLDEIAFISYGCRPCGNAKYPNLKKSHLIHKTPQGNAKPYIESKDSYIAPYVIHHNDFLDYQADKIYNAMFGELFTPTKLMCGRTLGNVNLINFVYDDKGRFCNDSMCCIVLWQDLQSATHQSPKKLITNEKIKLSQRYDLKFLQGVLNSKIIKFYVKELLHDGLHFYPEHQKQLPIPRIDSSNQKIADEIVELVEKILESKRADSTANTTALESQIDSLVYALYDLEQTEIRTIENR